MKTIGWGIIGCGDVTEVKSGPGFQKASNSRLVAVMRRNGDLAKDYACRHGVPRWYERAEALVEDPGDDPLGYRDDRQFGGRQRGGEIRAQFKIGR